MSSVRVNFYEFKMPARLTETERILLISMRGCGDNVRSYSEVAKLFNARFPERNPISKSTVFKTVGRFEETGKLEDRIRPGRTRKTDEVENIVLESFVENPHLSLRRSANVTGIHRSTVFRILKKEHFFPYKVSLVQHLIEADFEHRIEFCEIMQRKIDEDPNFHRKILFSDEATFMLNGTVSRHNCRYWNDVRPTWIQESHTQWPEKVNVWAGIIDSKVIGPFFIETSLTRESYLKLLRENVVPALREMYPDTFHEMWFQQDGAPAHFARDVRNFLDEVFPGKWIGRQGAVAWPARSPDLTPLDYFYWGHLKDQVYKSQPRTIEDLKLNIVNESANLTSAQLLNVINSFYFRLCYCLAAGGRQFEHLH